VFISSLQTVSDLALASVSLSGPPGSNEQP
jgi:hypothetical protein